jgi:hypothetical protein
MSAELLIYIGNIADNCQQYGRQMSADKWLQPVFNSYQVDGSRIRKSEKITTFAVQCNNKEYG